MLKNPTTINISTFPPTLCGIGTYSSYLLGRNWVQFAFDPGSYPSAKDDESVISYKGKKVVIDYQEMLNNPSYFVKNVKRFPNPVVIFQHTCSLYRSDDERFCSLLGTLKRQKIPVVLSLHTVHFQTNETPSGLGFKEAELLKKTYPLIDSFIIFTDGSYRAIYKHLKKWARKCVVIRHGVRKKDDLTMKEAKKILSKYLKENYDGSDTANDFIKVLKDDNQIIFGETGFYSQTKRSEILFKIKDHRWIKNGGKFTFAYFGSVRNSQDSRLTQTRDLIKGFHNPKAGRFVFDIFLPERVFRASMKIMANIFWPDNCTQSGRLSHAQSVGTLIIGKDIEGIGETLKMSGYPVFTDLEAAINRCILASERSKVFFDSKKNEKYISEFNWARQREKHELLTQTIINGKKLPDLDKGKFEKFVR